MVEVALALGSNLGDRWELLRKAVAALQQEVGSILAISSFIETAPVGFVSSHAFLNGAIVMKTSLSPLNLLEKTQAIERSLGRLRKHLPGEDYTDRPIDIDILLYGNETIAVEKPHLQIPHPKMHERAFVLHPLASIDPQAEHPQLHTSILELMRRCSRV